MQIDINPLLLIDSYKSSMHLQYPPGTQAIASYIESRGGRWPKTLFFGLQAFIRGYLNQRITMAHIDQAEEVHAGHGSPFNRAGFERIVDMHHGFWPVAIRAVPEGSVIPTGNPLLTIASTDPELPWVATYLETALLRAVWYPTTVATESFHAKEVIKHDLERTCDNPEAELPYKLHDFGARGAACAESAALGGMAHLVNFRGTDTLAAVMAARAFYGAEHPGASVPAAEHSTITSWGREGEVDAYRNMLAQFAKPGAVVSVVSDSYDLWNAIDDIWGGQLRREVIESGAVLVIRPDSGDPVMTPVWAVEHLSELFGYTFNAKGYMVLNHVRVIQGDGIDTGTIGEILHELTCRGFSVTNIAFGMGGKLVQSGIDRDTQRFAMKASAAPVNGVWRDVFKDPIDDPGKRSKRGLLALVEERGGYATVPLFGNQDRDLLDLVWFNGCDMTQETLETIRARAAQTLEPVFAYAKAA